MAPPDQLVRSMLGGRTRDEVSLAAFWRLKRRYENWSDLVADDYHTLLSLIGDVTFPEDKAANLQAALGRLDLSRGNAALDFLGGWPVDSALSWLESLPGVGRKTSAAVLNFSTLGKRALVIDSHHQRVAKRLGLVRWKGSVEETYDVLMAAAPQEWQAADYERHHILIKAHGQKRCHHLAPDCGRCPLADLCPALT
ncbi:endonuclease III domain-containing protein, partial [Euryhalocaulis caribicus]|uniref:endonuclease III domain-containing protein n=1 Tax=Euryhalocaulis caribicus TaxID=1161401 RepID=UPI0003B5366A